MSSFLEQLKSSFIHESEHIIDILPRFAIGIIGFLVAWFIGNRLKHITSVQLTKRMDDPLLASFFAKMLKVIILIGGLMFFLTQIGWGDAAAGIMATAGVGAFVVGFALRDIGENFLAGVIMAFQRPFRVGDTIKVNDITGVILGLSLRETHVKTFDGKDVYIPNGMILKNPLINYTIDGFIRKDITILLPNDADIDRAIQLVRSVVVEINGVLKDSKAPTISVTGITPEGLELQVFYWVDTDGAISVTDIHKEVITQSVGILLKNGFKLPKHIFNYNDYFLLNDKGS
ncbi:MAG TPA: mechanosensitive ion channel family protein [Saprospiraceae bacterium]|nr:mechanosensitive ion channel family protein [Saprospiraceae bacterium]